MKKPAIYQIEQINGNQTAIARMPTTDLPVKQVNFRTCGYNEPIAPKNLFGTSNGLVAPPLAPLNRR